MTWRCGWGAGWFRFGGVEFFKINSAALMGEEAALRNKTLVCLGSAACAELVANAFLYPLEATRLTH
eukprot:COSAG01_NODE_68604_length_263_cov_1.524390_1_plen_66_part_01